MYLNKDKMNNLKQFIKMSEKAIEVQKLHKPEVGDYYVCACINCIENITKPNVIEYADIDCLNNRDLTNVEPHYAATVKMSGVGAFAAFYNTRCKKDLSYIWLPKQNQLQDMVLNNNTCYGKHLYFHEWMKINQIHNYLKNWSMEQLWLAFVMFEKFNKVWDGCEWQKN